MQGVLLLQALAVGVGKSETCSLSQVSCLGDQIQGKVLVWETLQIWLWSDPKAWLEPGALAWDTVTHPLQLRDNQSVASKSHAIRHTCITEG